MMRKPFYLLAFCLVALVCAGSAQAQENPISGKIWNLNEQLPLDPSVRYGQLPNGLTYYIKQNPKPEARVELRLAVNAGSMQENEDQQGLAHFLEHMAFNGTANFDKNDIVSYLQSVGVRFGADLNAYTSFDETVYMLSMPTDDGEIVEKGFQILEDWAGAISLNGEDIDEERGVVMEEWRLGQGADQRMRDRYLPLMYKDSRYAERLPIGKKEVIENFDHETLRNFYKTWYRPNLMAVMVVGDMDPDEAEAKIKAHFGQLENPVDAATRGSHAVPDHDETYVAIEKDAEAAFTQVQLMYKQPHEPIRTFGDMRRVMVYELFNEMLNSRLDERGQAATPPYSFAFSYYGGTFARTKNAYQSVAYVNDKSIGLGLRTLLEENQRVKQHGFTQSELVRAKKSLLNQMERDFKEAGKTESSRIIGQYVYHFLENSAAPGPAIMNEFAQAYVPKIQLEEVNQLIEKWITEKNRVVVITGPDKEGVEYPTEEEVLALLNEVGNSSMEPYEDNLTATALMEGTPKPGKVANSVEIANVGVTELTLSNGVRVVLKSTDYKNDEVLMRAFSPGGSSLLSNEEYIKVREASSVVAEGGIGEFSTTDVTKLMQGKTASARPYISTMYEGFNGSAAPKDLEDMFRMVHLYFTAPREDAEAFESYKAKQVAFFKNLSSNPGFYFSIESNKILTQNHPRAGGFPTEEDYAAMDLGASMAFFKERFANAGDFTFFFVGNFTVEGITPLLETYLGSLPGTGRVEKGQDLGIRRPSGKLKQVINKGQDPKSQVSLIFHGEEEYDAKTAYVLRSAGELLSIKLIEKLREEIGGVYGVGASGSMGREPIGTYTFRIGFPCGPENVDKLIAAAMEEVEVLRKTGGTEEDLNKVKEQQRRKHETDVQSNRWWLGQLQNYYRYGQSFDDFGKFEELVNGLTNKDIKKVAKKYLKGENFVELILMPEEGTEAGE